MPIEAPTGVTPAVLGDSVFFGTEGGTFFGVNWQEAKVAWKYEDKADSQPLSQLARGAPTASSSSAAATGWCMRSIPQTGKELWSFHHQAARSTARR